MPQGPNALVLYIGTTNDAVRIPGDRERQMRLLRRAEGLPVAKRVHKVICDICEALSIPLPKDLYVDGPASAS